MTDDYSPQARLAREIERVRAMQSARLTEEAERLNRSVGRQNQENERVAAQANAPRIVCTKCPAVVVVHYFERMGDRFGEEYEVWYECHGEHVFGTLADRAPREYITSDVRAWADSVVHDRYTRAEREMQVQAERAALLKRFLDRKPPT